MANPRAELATIASVAQLLAVILSVAALFFARDVFIPLALGLLLSFLLSPIVNRLERFRVPNVMAVVTTALLAFLLIAGIFTLLGRELTTLVGDLPTHKNELVSKARGLAGLTDGMGGSLDKLATEVTQAIEGDSEPVQESTSTEDSFFQRWTDRLLPADVAEEEPTNDGKTVKSPIYVVAVKDELPLATWATTAGTLLGPLATAGLVTVFALFMLIHRENLRDRITAVVSHGNYVTTTEAMDEAANRISRYLIAQTIINSGYGIVLTIGLLTIGGTMTDEGFPNAILWGVLTTCLRFIPYLGPTAAAIFPSAMAFAVFPGYSVFIAVVALITTMELLCNNVIEPWFYGSSTGVSAVAVILAAVFWGWLWGPVGLLLSTPLTVCLVVLGRYVPRFKIFATLFSDEVEIKPSIRFYQRLLAGDEYRARDILKQRIQQRDFDSGCDEVLIPALKRIRFDHDADYLTDTDANRLFALAGGLIEECATIVHQADTDEINNDIIEEPTDDAGSTLPTIIGCTSHHYSETLTLNLLRIGGKGVYKLNTIDEDTLPLEVGRQVADIDPPVVVISVLPKGGFAQARYLCKSIRREGYDGAVIVVCYGKFKSYDKLFVKFRKVGATSMTTSHSQTKSKIESILKRRDPVKPRLPVAGPVGAVFGALLCYFPEFIL